MSYPAIVYGAPFPAKKCGGCEAGRKLLDAERELRRRLREWLANAAVEDVRESVRQFCGRAALAKLTDLERELLGEEK